MLSVTVRRETMPLPPVRGVKWDMPRGDAARIRAYAVGLVDDARGAGETGDNGACRRRTRGLGAGLPEGPHQHMPGPGDPQIAGGGRGGTGGEARAQAGPQLGFRVQAPRRQGIAPDSGVNSNLELTRRRRPFSAGASVCRGPGGSPGAEAGRDSAPTHRSNVTSSPDTGGLAVSAGSRCVERETVLAVHGCGPAAVGPPPIPPETRWPIIRRFPSFLLSPSLRPGLKTALRA